MPRLSTKHLREYRKEAAGAMDHQNRFKDPKPLPAQLALGEALWVALLRMGYPSMDAFAKREGFRLHIVSYNPNPAEGYAGLRTVEISYYVPGDSSKVIGARMQAIRSDLGQLLRPILGDNNLGKYIRSRDQSWVKPPTLGSIEIDRLPVGALRRLREVTLK